ncbi:MAG: aspartate aminotransferase family protein [Actinobacteria bacterium]|nr:aspartate aminotransferase family protein [Actinomycetota bacterium]
MIKLKTETGDKLYEFAKQYLVAGGSASARFNQALRRPLYLTNGKGSKIYDVDGNEYIDMCISHGGSILGHRHPKILEAIQKALELGIICSYETEFQSKLAKKICDMVPAAELVRYTCSGTEATMHSIRLAREYTKKEKIIKFEGHFHGYHDYVQFSWAPPLDKAGPYDNPVPFAQSGGIPERIKDYVIVLPFNDIDLLEKAIKKNKDEVAAVILEPINYNSGCIIPDKEYMKAMRELTAKNGILLLYDEILSAFRTGVGCAQEYFDVVPDLCMIGKCVAGGTPLSVIAGKRGIMQHMRPIGHSEHSGTYTGHLIPVMAAIACLDEISSPGFYDHIYKLAGKLYDGLNQIFSKSKIVARVQGLGARFGFYFGIDEEVKEYRTAAKNDRLLNLKFYKEMLKRGVYFHDYNGKPCHHGFSSQHTMKDIEEVLNRAEDAVKEIEKGI